MNQSEEPNLEQRLAATVASLVVVPIAILYGMECLREWESDRGTTMDLVLAITAIGVAIVAALSPLGLLLLLFRWWQERFRNQIDRMAQPQAPVPATRILLYVVLEEVVIVGICGLIFLTARRNGEAFTSIVQVVAAAGLTMQLLPIGHGISRRVHLLVGQMTVAAGAIVVAFWTAIAVCTTMDVLNFRNADPLELTMVAVAVGVGGMTLGAIVQAVRIYRAERQVPGEVPK